MRSCAANSSDMTESLETHRRLAQALIVTSAALLLWAAAVAITGGFRVELGSIRISSRNASRIFLIAALPAALAWRLAYRERLEVWLQSRRMLLRTLAVLATFAVAGGFVVAGVLYGSRTAAASDQSGYVSQSALWARGTLKIDVGLRRGAAVARREADPDAARLPHRRRGAMVPTYAPGVPMLMALARTIASCGPYLVGTDQRGAARPVHVSARASDLRGVHGRGRGALVACSPVVVFMSLLPMADVPAAAFWVGALAVAVGGSSARTVGAGLMTAMAVLHPPEPGAAGAVPMADGDRRGAQLAGPRGADGALCRGQPARALARRLGQRHAVWIATFVRLWRSRTWLHARERGREHPPVSGLVARESGAVRLPVPRRLSGTGSVAATCVAKCWSSSGSRSRVALLYLFYLPFDAWWFLRFVVPAVPIALLLCADTVARAAGSIVDGAFCRARRLHGDRRIACDAVHRHPRPARHRHRRAALPGAGAPHRVRHSSRFGRSSPMQHSGSVRYYTGRMIVRWDALDPAWLDRAVEFLRERGIATYLLVEHWEEEPIPPPLRGSAHARRPGSQSDRDRAVGEHPAVFAAVRRVLDAGASRHSDDVRPDLLRSVAGLPRTTSDRAAPVISRGLKAPRYKIPSMSGAVSTRVL